MMRKLAFAPIFLVVATLFLCLPCATAQVESGLRSRPRIIPPIDETTRVSLSGNIRPEVRPENDRGRVGDAFSMEHMLLQLKRSPEQEKALQQFVDELHTQGSPNFHHWLTAQEFGERFGLAQPDLEAITAWLQSHGFRVNVVYSSGMLIDFSGTAGQIREAFQTDIHQLEVKGERHIANTRDPSIPAALASVISGVVSLHDFHPNPMYQMRKPHPEFTFTDIFANTTYAVVPADLATIYNLNPLLTSGISGQGQTIVLIEDTDVFSPSDWNTFRSTFGLSGFISASFSTVHPAPSTGTNNCAPPGVIAPNDAEAILDAEWASASAPSAAIEMVACADTTTTFGGLIAIQNLINGNTLPPAIMSISYGQCETVNGAAANASYNSAYQQAVTEGVSVFVAAGDSGAAGCDNSAAEATHGIGVNAFASTPNNVAVGGTDFSDTYFGTNANFWNSSNTPAFGSARSYIPETPWNDSCAGGLLSANLGYSPTYGSTSLCNDPLLGSLLMTTVAGGGGPSQCGTGTPSTSGVVSGSCAGWPKPSWQSLLGNPDDGVRDTPDVSLFAADGLWGHYYIFCWSDTKNGGAACGSDPSSWSGAGGTSFASPIMAGIQALINQRAGGPQGNPAPVYYQLAATEYGSTGNSSCNSSNGPNAASTCIFYDVTLGDMDVDCVGPNCYLADGSVGVLSTSQNAFLPAYGTSIGWDSATGIGAINAANLVNSWPVCSSCGATAPSAPKGLAATPGNAQASLTWNSSSGASTYNVYRSTTGGPPYSQITRGLTATSYTNTGLTNGTTYYYVVTAVNSGGESGYSNQTSAIPVAPPLASTGLAATPGNAQVSLTWNASAGATSYNVYNSTTNGGPYTEIISVTTPNYTNTGLTNGTTYYYVVTAVNSSGQSGNSNQASAVPTAGSSWSNGYSFRRSITIDHTKVPNTDQTNFPVLISGAYSYLATVANGGNVTNTNGYDIIFTSNAAGTSPLASERESYNASTGAINYWVKIPTLSHSSDTVVYMFYGNSSVTTDQSNKTAVWDGNYKAVWHLNETSGTVNHDSTSNNIAANKNSSTSPSPAAGLFGGVQSFNGSTDYDTVLNTSAIDVGAANHTVSIWFKANSYSSYNTLFTKEGNPSGGGNRDYSYWVNSTSDGWWAAGNTGGTSWGASGFTTGSWHYLVMTRSGNSETAYLDGNSAVSTTFSGTTDSGGNLEIGADHLFGGYYWNGFLGELRVSNTTRSAGWITTEYNNQSSPSTFYGVGAAVTGGL